MVDLKQVAVGDTVGVTNLALDTKSTGVGMVTYVHPRGFFAVVKVNNAYNESFYPGDITNKFSQQN